MEERENPAWMATRGARYPPHDRSEFSGFGVVVTYPQDCDLKVGLRIYAPHYVAGIGKMVRALAKRMVTIPTCLEVTDDAPRGGAEMRLAFLRAENAELRGALRKFGREILGGTLPLAALSSSACKCLVVLPGVLRSRATNGWNIRPTLRPTQISRISPVNHPRSPTSKPSP
ncbi:hypothetical protein [Jannaschia faecimaris]|nr:hypothetical protein [Jannaschia faecimaris]